MSLEIAIAELNTNIRDLIAALSTGASVPVKESKPAKVEKVKADPKPEPVAEVAPVATPEPKDEPAPAAADPVADISKQDVIDITLALGKAGKRAQLIELLGKFGAPKASELAPEKFAEYHAAATALLEV
jgi:hypothetical protein